jgi:hypothetical protein
VFWVPQEIFRFFLSLKELFFQAHAPRASDHGNPLRRHRCSSTNTEDIAMKSPNQRTDRAICLAAAIAFAASLAIGYGYSLACFAGLIG